MKNKLHSHLYNGAPASTNGAIPIVLTIAGSDPTSGAGIQADLKTFAAHGVHGLSVITAITAQNTRGVKEIFPVSLDAVKAQCETLLADIPVKFIKTGMIYDAETCDFIADFISEKQLIAVVDTPFAGSDGTPLMKKDAFEIFVKKLLTKAELVTPNIPEAEKISGMKIDSRVDIELAASIIIERGTKAILIKGGHLEGDHSPDFLKTVTDSFWLDSNRLEASMHGTGCILSAAITANLALGYDLLQSVRRGKDFITKNIEKAVKIGSGQRVAALN